MHFGYRLNHISGAEAVAFPPMERSDQPPSLAATRTDTLPALCAVPMALPRLQARVRGAVALAHDNRGGVPIVVLLDGSLNLSLGKACAQAAHCTMAVQWDEDDPLVIAEVEHDLLRSFVESASPLFECRDAGRTEVVRGTLTAVAFNGRDLLNTHRIAP